MPELVLKQTGEAIQVAPENLSRALASGLYEDPGAGATAQVSTAQGVVDVPVEQLGTFQQYGDPLASTEQSAALEREAYVDRRFGGPLAAAATFVEQGLNEATFGASGFLGEQALGEEYGEAFRGRAEANPTAAAIGGAAGVLAPALASGGTGLAAKVLSKTGAGAAARVGEGIVAKAAGRGAVAETAAAMAGYGVEGALLGSGHVLAETVLHDKELSAEAFLAGAEEGMLWGGAAGGAGSLLSRGTKAAKGLLDDSLAKQASLKELEAAQKAAAKADAQAQKELARAKIRQERSLNQRAMEELRTEGRLKVVEARNAGRAEVAQIGADTRLAVADKGLEKALAQAEAKAAVARAKVTEISERVAVEQERTARAQLLMDGRLELADKYTSGWRRAADSRESVAASKLEAAAIGADSRTRSALADAIVRSGRSDAGVLVEELIPKAMRSPRAAQAARAEIVTQAARLTATTDDLVRKADELIAINPAVAPEIAAAREAAVQSAPAVAAWSQRATAGADNFAEGFTTIRQAEQAQHDLAQVLRGHVDEVTGAAIDQATAGMDQAVAKTDEIVTDAISRQVDAATGSGRGTAGTGSVTDSAAVADLLLSGAGMPNTDDIPVVGPVLGAYLKFRAVHGAIGKLGIRLPGPVGRIAQIGAGVQNRASDVVQAIVVRAPAAAKVVERASPSLTMTLGRPLWESPEGGRDEAPAVKGDPLRLYRQRVDELDRAIGDPEGTRRKIVDSIPAPPSVANAIADAKMRQLEYLHSQVPADPRPPTIRPREPRPNLAEARRLGEQIYACERPVEAIKDVLDGNLSPLAANAVKAVFPRLFQAMQEQLVEKLAEAGADVSFDRLCRAALVFDVPLSTQTSPEYIAARQAEYAAAKQATQATPTGGAQLRLSQLEEPGAARRAMR